MRGLHKLLNWTSNLSLKQSKPYNIVKPGSVSPSRHVPNYIPKPDYSRSSLLLASASRIIDKKSQDELQKMKRACILAKQALQKAKEAIEVGLTTDDIDHIVHHEIISHDAYPSPLKYKGFPKSCCTSVNNVTCHGIPDDYALQDGDIINVDVSVFFDGFHGDTSDTFPVGKPDEDAQRLITTTRECLDLAINACAPGERFNVIGDVIEDHAKAHGYTVCPSFIGHGIGTYFHGPPNVWHTRKLRRLELMETGMTFTIEPILMEGWTGIVRLDDGWTVVSRDKGRSAQAEHTLVLSDEGAVILT